MIFKNIVNTVVLDSIAKKEVEELKNQEEIKGESLSCESCAFIYTFCTLEGSFCCYLNKKLSDIALSQRINCPYKNDFGGYKKKFREE